MLQAKLTVNTPGDEYEQEAYAVADKVMRMSNPATISPSQPPDESKNNIQLKPIPFSQISRKCAHCEEEDKVQRKEGTGGSGQTAPSIVNDVIASSGKPLDGNTQQFMESRMGHDFSHVQVHTDGKAAESATAVNALAYTSGNHIVFNSGQYAPNTEGGKRLLAHELVHVGQQKMTNLSVQRDPIKSSPTPPKPVEMTPDQYQNVISEGEDARLGFQQAVKLAYQLYITITKQAESKSVHEKILRDYSQAKETLKKMNQKSTFEKVITGILTIVDFVTSVASIIGAAKAVYTASKTFRAAYDLKKDIRGGLLYGLTDTAQETATMKKY